MTVKPQLVLDVGGVLLTNLSPPFWQELTASTAIAYTELVALYKENMSQSLWSGRVTEEQFWDWLCDQCATIDRQQARALLQKNLTPLPALDLLPEWSRIADIHLLSNHRIEWIGPCLADARHFITSMTISGSAGVAKPDPGIYKIASEHLDPDRPVLFVDDKQSNLTEASRLGWHTLLADEEGRWLQQVIPRLKQQ